MSLTIINLVSTYCLAFASNFISQKKYSNVPKSVDYKIANAYAIATCLLVAIYMYMLLFIRSMSKTRQIVIETLFFMIIGNYIFINAYDIMIEGVNYDHSKTIKKYIPSVVAFIKVWPIFNYIKVTCLPIGCRIIVGGIVGFFYNIYLSSIISSQND